MILGLIINFFALIGVLTTGLFALALWAYVSDEETFETFPIIDMTDIPLEEFCEDTDKEAP